MTIKVGINGFGRIGRNILRALYESGRTDEISIVAVNDLGDAETNAHLTRHDTTHGRFPGEVKVDGNDLIVLCRTSLEGLNNHDTNLITLHRIQDFRELVPRNLFRPISTVNWNFR